MDRYPSLHFQCGPWTSPMISRPTSRCQYFFGHHSGHLGFCPTTLSSIVLNEWVSLLFFLLVCFYIFTQSSLLRLISSKMLMTQKQFSLSLALYLFLLHTHAHKHTHVFFMEKIQIKDFIPGRSSCAEVGKKHLRILKSQISSSFWLVNQTHPTLQELISYCHVQCQAKKNCPLKKVTQKSAGQTAHSKYFHQSYLG